MCEKNIVPEIPLTHDQIHEIVTNIGDEYYGQIAKDICDKICCPDQAVCRKGKDKCLIGTQRWLGVSRVLNYIFAKHYRIAIGVSEKALEFSTPKIIEKEGGKV